MPVQSIEREDAVAGLDGLRRLLSALEPARTHRPREVIFRCDDEPQGLYLVVDGAVLLRSCAIDGEPLLHGVVLKGAWFGETAALSEEPQRHDAVTAHGPARTARIRQRVLKDMLTEDPVVAQYLMNVLLSRYSAQFDRAIATHRTSPKARVARALADALHVDVPQLSPRAPREIPVSQSALSEMTGLARQTVNRALKALCQGGILRCTYATVTVLDPCGLRRAADGAQVDAERHPSFSPEW